MGPTYFWWSGMWIFPSIMMTAFITCLFIFMRRGTFPCFGPHQNRGHSSNGETAEEILKKRYARGEISKEEFESIRKDIR